MPCVLLRSLLVLYKHKGAVESFIPVFQRGGFVGERVLDFEREETLTWTANLKLPGGAYESLLARKLTACDLAEAGSLGGL